ncbi:Uncharacterized protein APZ42_026745 [Daphnia magna]|uniref:Uncharacterized protein n=1 Tax=Daphnia magna TaxID=35525 RepID=A0A164RWP7_9CRUS|nr:Uncharacterized protein APZ42_026745 [Daphnia magna]
MLLAAPFNRKLFSLSAIILRPCRQQPRPRSFTVTVSLRSSLGANDEGNNEEEVAEEESRCY